MDGLFIQPMRGFSVQKFDNCPFPIGVKFSNNSVYVCNSGNNIINIYNDQTGKLRHQINCADKR